MVAESAWNRFWFAEGGTLALGLFRIAFAVVLWFEVDLTFRVSRFAVEGGFHLPYVGFVQPVSETAYRWMHVLQYPFVISIGLGWLMRSSCAALLLLQGWVFFADQLNFRNHPYFFGLLLVLLIASPADDALSLRTLIRMLRARRRDFSRLLGSVRPLTAQRMMQVQICLVYFFAALHKLDAGFLGGVVLSHYLAKSGAGAALFGERFVEIVGEPRNLIPLSWSIVTLELGLAFGLWSRRTRFLWMIAGVAMHVAIALLMGIYTFSFAVIAGYLLFLKGRSRP